MNTKQISRWLTVVTLSCLALFLIVAESQAADEPKEQKPVPIQWRTDYNEARKEAEAKKRPLVIVIWNPTNGPSERLLSEIGNHRELATYLNENAVALSMDATKDRALASALNISQYPTTIIAMPDGKIVETLIGYQEPEKVLESVKKATLQKK